MPIENGSWWLMSMKDSRWNCSGNGIVGMFSIPSECEKKIEELKKELGNPPDDLRWGYMKD